MFLAAALLVLGLSGCAKTTIQTGLTYPTGLQRGTTLDIQVFRRMTKIEITNTTAKPYGKSILWLNGRFSKEIDGLAVGQTIVFPLKQFKDEFGESFRGGGFFAAERPERLALAELQPMDANPPAMLSLIVVGGSED